MESIGSHCCGGSPFTFITRNSSLPRLTNFTRRVHLGRQSERLRNSPTRLTCAASSSSTIEEQLKKKDESGTKVKLNVRLNHQVKFGEHVAMFGSAKEIGSWKKKSPLTWTENGWVCDLELSGGQALEYKFVIVQSDGSLSWESGDNRVLRLPNSGSFSVVCHWNATGETLDFPQEDAGGGHESSDNHDVGDDRVVGSENDAQLQKSTLAGQWQGKDASFMRSNEHGNREVGRNWDTTGLEGPALKMVEAVADPEEIFRGFKNLSKGLLRIYGGSCETLSH